MISRIIWTPCDFANSLTVEIKEESEIFNVGAFSLWETESLHPTRLKKKNYDSDENNNLNTQEKFWSSEAC